MLALAAFVALASIPALMGSKRPDPAHVYDDPDDIFGRELWRD